MNDKNQKLASHLYTIAYLASLEFDGKYRSAAYSIAAEIVAQEEEDVTSKNANSYKGIGPSITKTIAQFENEGNSAKCKALTTKYPEEAASYDEVKYKEDIATKYPKKDTDNNETS